jgi:hypothetical protein
MINLLINIGITSIQLNIMFGTTKAHKFRLELH